MPDGGCLMNVNSETDAYLSVHYVNLSTAH